MILKSNYFSLYHHCEQALSISFHNGVDVLLYYTMQNVLQWFIFDDDHVRLSVIQLLLGPRPFRNPDIQVCVFSRSPTVKDFWPSKFCLENNVLTPNSHFNSIANAR